MVKWSLQDYTIIEGMRRKIDDFVRIKRKYRSYYDGFSFDFESFFLVFSFHRCHRAKISCRNKANILSPFRLDSPDLQVTNTSSQYILKRQRLWIHYLTSDRLEASLRVQSRTRRIWLRVSFKWTILNTQHHSLCICCKPCADDREEVATKSRVMACGWESERRILSSGASHQREWDMLYPDRNPTLAGKSIYVMRKLLLFTCL